MEEKERYELKIYAGCESYSITDTKEKQQITLNNVINLLNKQDKRIKELQQQLAEHNEFFNAFDCKDFNEFKDFISTFMLVPHEEQTLIRELKQQLEETKKNCNYQVILMCSKENVLLKQQLHDLPKKIVGELKEWIKSQIIYCGGKANEVDILIANASNQVLEDLQNILDTILKKYGGEDE